MTKQALEVAFSPCSFLLTSSLLIVERSETPVRIFRWKGTAFLTIATFSDRSSHADVLEPCPPDLFFTMPQLSPLQHALVYPDVTERDFQWRSYLSYACNTNMQDSDNHASQSGFAAQGAQITNHGSTSSLASALDERMMGPPSPLHSTLHGATSQGQYQAAQPLNSYSQTRPQEIGGYQSATSDCPPYADFFGEFELRSSMWHRSPITLYRILIPRA